VPKFEEETAFARSEALEDSMNLYLGMIKKQEAVFQTMAACEKPADMGFILEPAKEYKKALIALGRKDRSFGTHLRVLEDAQSIFAWY